MCAATNSMTDVFAFDWGINIVGVLDINADVYRAYRTRNERIEGAKRIVECAGIIVSFNGYGRDLVELSKILSLPAVASLTLKGTHHDMMPIISAIRWPPDPGTAPITGPHLAETYRHLLWRSCSGPTLACDRAIRDLKLARLQNDCRSVESVAARRANPMIAAADSLWTDVDISIS
jgi:hypothetical protein